MCWQQYMRALKNISKYIVNQEVEDLAERQ